MPDVTNTNTLQENIGIQVPEGLNGTALQRVSIRLPRANSNTTITLEQLDVFHQQVANQRIADIKAVVNPVAERLKIQGYQVSTNDYATRINVRLTPEVIREVEKWNEVKKIFIDRVNQPELEVARPTIGGF